VTKVIRQEKCGYIKHQVTNTSAKL